MMSPAVVFVLRLAGLKRTLRKKEKLALLQVWALLDPHDDIMDQDRRCLPAPPWRIVSWSLLSPLPGLISLGTAVVVVSVVDWLHRSRSPRGGGSAANRPIPRVPAC